MKYSRLIFTLCLSAAGCLILIQLSPTKAPAASNAEPRPIQGRTESLASGAPQKVSSPDTLPAKVSDFDHDGKADRAVFLPPFFWYVRYDNGTTSAHIFNSAGSNTDILVPADYTTDLSTNLAVWDSIFRIYETASDVPPAVPVPTPFMWGSTGDTPVAGDFIGSARADYVVAHPVLGSLQWWGQENGGTGSFVRVYGSTTDILVPGDYDGDNKTDIVTYSTMSPNTGLWCVLSSSSGFMNSSCTLWGTAGDIPLLGDFDGDGRDDMAVVRNTGGQWVWYIRLSSTGVLSAITFGLAPDSCGRGDIPVPADYDGDGKTDVAVYRGTLRTWYVYQSSNTVVSYVTFGSGACDVPIPAAYVKCPTPTRLCF